ncbi:aldose epimerase [Ornithinibacillus sp. L9]|uniref:Aldose epimerase n=1 Tax=Ornithinibacillus caprae TaxID=2678566 RepID=A0A6N8FG86_9BACI|nr:aldose epimerase [Ornithinibacillus caprae]MUK87696.1 aldose epimerase [Ornithinibacillus caprae]
MYQIQTFEEQSFTMYQLSNADDSAWVTICPERGGIITSFGVDGKEQLYINKETLYDRSKNIRGGIPILFPIAGQLEEGKYEWDGETYNMPNHGLARIYPWEVVEKKQDETQASITVRFVSSISTKAVYPFDFDVLFTYTIRANELLIEQSFGNVSDQAMPMYVGLHPYFKASQKNVVLKTDTTKLFDYSDESVQDFQGSVDMENRKESVVLLDAKARKVSMELGTGQEVHMETGAEYKYTVIWTEKGKEFICVEPWMAMAGELNRKEELVMIEPKETLDTFVRFRVE